MIQTSQKHPLILALCLQPNHLVLSLIRLKFFKENLPLKYLRESKKKTVAKKLKFVTYRPRNLIFLKNIPIYQKTGAIWILQFSQTIQKKCF